MRIWQIPILLVLPLILALSWLLSQREAFDQAQMHLRARASAPESRMRYATLATEARARAWFYEEGIQRDFLDKGMVVHRGLSDGRAMSVCDSLLFSSLRYVALHKMGWQDEADLAWQQLEQSSHQDGRWLRHPDCRRKSSSRDMLVGLLAALSQEPRGHELAFAELLGIIERTQGAVDEGPFYVSRLTPGLSEITRQMALARGYRLDQLPAPLRVGFATVEFDSWRATPGYASHLNALTLWLELELQQRNTHLELRTLSGLLDRVLPDWGTPSLVSQRQAFAAQKLHDLDPQNLFFTALHYKTSGVLTPQLKAELLEKLLAMPQFPADRMPRDCDRAADYLWQRSSREYVGKKKCTEAFNAVDFLWITALLTEDAPFATAQLRP